MNLIFWPIAPKRALDSRLRAPLSRARPAPPTTRIEPEFRRLPKWRRVCGPGTPSKRSSSSIGMPAQTTWSSQCSAWSCSGPIPTSKRSPSFLWCLSSSQIGENTSRCGQSTSCMRHFASWLCREVTLSSMSQQLSKMVLIPGSKYFRLLSKLQRWGRASPSSPATPTRTWWSSSSQNWALMMITIM